MSEIMLIFAPEDQAPAESLAEALASLGVDVTRQPLLAFSDAVRQRMSTHAAVVIGWSRRSVLDDRILDAALFAAELEPLAAPGTAGRYCGAIFDDTLRALLPKPFFTKDAASLSAWFASAPAQRFDEPGMSRLVQALETLTGRAEIAFVAQALDARASDETGHVTAAVSDFAPDVVLDRTLESSPPEPPLPAPEPEAAPTALPPDVAAILRWTGGLTVEREAEPDDGTPKTSVPADASEEGPALEETPAPSWTETEFATPSPDQNRHVNAAVPDAEAIKPDLETSREADVVHSALQDAAEEPSEFVLPPVAAVTDQVDQECDAPAADDSSAEKDGPVTLAQSQQSDDGSEPDPRDDLIAELQMQLTGMRIQRGFEATKFQEQDAKFAQLSSDLARERETAAAASAAAQDASAAAQLALSEAASLRSETSKLLRAVEEARQAYAAALRQQKGLEAQVHAGDLTLREVMGQREELLSARAQLEKTVARLGQDLSSVTAKFNEAENARKTYELALLDRKTEILSLQSKLDATGTPPKPTPSAAAAKSAAPRPKTTWASIAAGGVFGGIMLSYAAVSTNEMLGEWLSPAQTVSAAQPGKLASPPPNAAPLTAPPSAVTSPAGEPPPAQTAHSDVPVSSDPAAPPAEPDAPAPEGPLGVPVSDHVVFNPDGLPPPDPNSRPPPQDLPPMQQKPRLLLKPPAPAEP